MIYYTKWRSILVGAAAFEEGPKNPSKGTTVKPVVSASYAQFGVDAGGRRFRLRRTGGSQWHGSSDPVAVETGTCAGAWISVRFRVGTCIAVLPGFEP